MPIARFADTLALPIRRFMVTLQLVAERKRSLPPSYTVAVLERYPDDYERQRMIGGYLWQPKYKGKACGCTTESGLEAAIALAWADYEVRWEEARWKGRRRIIL